MAMILVTIEPGLETEVERVKGVNASTGAITTEGQVTDTEQLVELIGRASELAFEGAKNPAELADLQQRIMTRLVNPPELNREATQ